MTMIGKTDLNSFICASEYFDLSPQGQTALINWPKIFPELGFWMYFELPATKAMMATNMRQAGTMKAIA